MATDMVTEKLSTGAAVSNKSAPDGSWKGAGANVVTSKQKNGGPDRKGKK
jgi:hypothetical protein